MSPTPAPGGIPQVVGPGTPYVTPELLVNAVTGISWSTVPERGASPAEQYAAQLDLCTRATAMVDATCNMPLRATVDTDQVVGPGTFQCQIQPSGTARILLTRSPVTSVVGGQVSAAAAFPPSWTTVAANQFRLEKPVFGIYGSTAPSGAGEGGQAVIMAPGWVTWGFGRETSLISVTYINGWPHGCLREAAGVGATSIHIDDITGWDGASGTLYDSGSQEVVYATAVTPDTSGAISGPGVLTLSAPLVYAHAAGTLSTTLPGSVIQSAILFASSQALIRGATATTVQTISGVGTGSAGGSPEALAKAARDLLASFRRVV